MKAQLKMLNLKIHLFLFFSQKEITLLSFDTFDIKVIFSKFEK